MSETTASVETTYATRKQVRAITEAVRELATTTSRELDGLDERCVRSFTTQANFNAEQVRVNRAAAHRVRLLTLACLLNTVSILVLVATR